MIELKLTVSEIDYDAVIARFAGSLGGVAAMAARALPAGAKEELAVKYLNTNAARLSQQLEELAAGSGVRVKIASAEAKAV